MYRGRPGDGHGPRESVVKIENRKLKIENSQSKKEVTMSYVTIISKVEENIAIIRSSDD